MTMYKIGNLELWTVVETDVKPGQTFSFDFVSSPHFLIFLLITEKILLKLASSKVSSRCHVVECRSLDQSQSLKFLPRMPSIFFSSRSRFFLIYILYRISIQLSIPVPPYFSQFPIGSKLNYSKQSKWSLSLHPSSPLLLLSLLPSSKLI